MKYKIYIIVDQTKSTFILCQVNEDNPNKKDIVCSTTPITVPIQATNRALKVLTENSNIINAHSTGKSIYVSGLSLLEPSEEFGDNDNLVHYRTNNDQYKIISTFQTIADEEKILEVKKSDEIKTRPKQLKTYGTIFKNSFILTIANNFEKIGYFNIVENGLIGNGDLGLFNSFSYSQQMWPELEMKVQTKGNEIKCSLPPHIAKHFETPGVYRVHRNWNATCVRIFRVYELNY